MPASLQWLLWAPLGAACIHMFEEFAWPGGFRGWYRTYRGNAGTVSRRFLFFINAGLLIGLIQAALVGSTVFGVAWLLIFSAILFSNGCWHIWASYRTRSYSPGTISGALLYLPLAVFEYTGWMQLGRASFGIAALAFLIGCSYPLWSALYHQRSKNELSARAE